MKYETPELTTVTTAITVIQTTKQPVKNGDTPISTEESVGAYQDWE
jgi:hypothetical protein